MQILTFENLPTLFWRFCKKFSDVMQASLGVLQVTALILDESSTMDDDLGGGEGVASSDDVNDISSAAQESLSTGIRYLLYTSSYKLTVTGHFSTTQFNIVRIDGALKYLINQECFWL